MAQATVGRSYSSPSNPTWSSRRAVRSHLTDGLIRSRVMPDVLSFSDRDDANYALVLAAG